jgi:uncharacterized protein (DUF2147 family)
MKAFFLAVAFCFANSFITLNPADAIVGIWQNGAGKGHIQIYKQSGKYFGKIVWLKDANDQNGKPKVDHKNDDPNKRSRPLIGLVMLRDFEYKNGEWRNGRIYNPSDGREYKAYIKSEDNKTLSIRGYMGISLIGKTDTWTRVK